MMVVVWTAAVLLGRIGIPRIIGELLMGVILGPAVLGWIEPNEIIEVLAELGIFFLILHTGIQTKPGEFFVALRISLGVALVGAMVPFAVAIGVAHAFGLGSMAALFVGLAMTATAIVACSRNRRPAYQGVAGVTARAAVGEDRDTGRRAVRKRMR